MATIRSRIPRWRRYSDSSRLQHMAIPHPLRRLMYGAIAWLAASSACAATTTYRYDPVHSQVVFSVDHDRFLAALRALSSITHGSLQFDPHDWRHASTELDIDVSALDMGNPEWSAAVCKPSLLDCKAHPLAHFVSSKR